MRPPAVYIRVGLVSYGVTHAGPPAHYMLEIFACTSTSYQLVSSGVARLDARRKDPPAPPHLDDSRNCSRIDAHSDARLRPAFAVACRGKRAEKVLHEAT
ncbi:hypothetical protein B0H11DRAFT_2217644 [Mycena galericulata]|nr:hypothetical protein B0H11DRAFT_2217644 [Mycena galericulata]